jgi:predicted DCC family thiol-disulfide oxidoreductase YuxK
VPPGLNSPMPPPRHRVAAPPARPLVLFDGDCRFCRRWAARWREEFGGRLDLIPSAEARGRFPEIPATACQEALQLVEPDGTVCSGAEAVLRARAHGRGRRGFWLWCHARVPGAASLLEFGYRIVARNRRVFSMLIR